MGKVSPVIQDDQVSYIYIQYSNLYLLALSRNNSNAVAIIAFLHKLVGIFKHYFREVSPHVHLPSVPPAPRHPFVCPAFKPYSRGPLLAAGRGVTPG